MDKKRSSTVKFSIGYNHDIGLLKILDAYKDNIEAFYFPIPSYYLGSGRHVFQRKGYAHEIPGIIRKCSSLNIRSQLLLNATCETEKRLGKAFFSKIIAYIEGLKSLGLKSLVITNPIYISEIKRNIRGIAIESSVNCYVKTVEHALYLRDLGVDVLTIDRDINRDIPLIKKIRDKTGLKLKMVLNEGCLRNCPFRTTHYNYLSHGYRSRDIDNGFCIEILKRNPAKVFSIPFIVPEALHYYKDIVDYYKLSTRVFSTPQIKSCLEAYIRQDFNGDLLKLLDCLGLSYFDFIDYKVLKRKNFFETMLKCDKDCVNCNYCNELEKRTVLVNLDLLKGDERIRESKRSIKVYKKILSATHNNPPIHSRLGKAYFNTMEYEKAIEESSKAIELKEGEFDGCLVLGLSYMKTRQYKKSIEVFKKAQKINPEESRIHFFLAKCYSNTGYKRQANKELEEGFLKTKKYSNDGER